MLVQKLVKIHKAARVVEVDFTNRKVLAKSKIFSYLTPEQKKAFFTKAQLSRVLIAAKRELKRE